MALLPVVKWFVLGKPIMSAMGRQTPALYYTGDNTLFNKHVDFKGNGKHDIATPAYV
jgi:hypothetical protein